MIRSIVFAGASLLLTFSVEAGLIHPAQKLVASNPTRGDRFGDTLDISGDVLFVGVPQRDTYPNVAAGGAYIFQRDATGTWSQTQELIPSQSGMNGQFARSLAIDAHTALIADGDRASFYQRGATGVWSYADSVPSTGYLTYFGWSMDVSGDTAIIAAPGEGPLNMNRGAAHIYQADGTGKWNHVTTLVGSNVENHDQFGSRVAIHGNTAVVSAIYDEVNQQNFETGLVYLFQNDGMNNWREVSQIAPDDGSFGSVFGASLSFDGRLLVVGAPYSGSNDTGSAYVFECDPTGGCRQMAKLLPHSPRDYGQFGISSVILGNQVVIGGGGEISIFRANELGIWEWIESIAPADLGASQHSGGRLAADGSTLVISDVLDPDIYIELGAVYALEIPEPHSVQTALICIVFWTHFNRRRTRH